MRAGLQALLTVALLSIEGWIHPGGYIIMLILVSVTVLYKDFGGELAEGLFRHANFEGKGGFLLKRYFCKNESSQTRTSGVLDGFSFV